MPFHINISTRIFHFRQPATTSRGTYNTRRSWFVTLTADEKPGVQGIGECAPLPQLSCDHLPDYEEILQRACAHFCNTGRIDVDRLRPYPSILFGLETALLQWQNNGSTALSASAFARGEIGIPINGLIWMGTFDEMTSRIEEKIKQGFGCMKLKIGAIDFDSELKLLRRIRERFTPAEVELRVDANGAFALNDVSDRLQQLAEFGLHSIEQPIRQGQWREMAEVCRRSPVPVALDEELIGVNNREQKKELLNAIRPAYIILKPSLHGGICGTREWIDIAQQLGIGWWLTSALESNVGLNSIAHLAADVCHEPIDMPQGLGTGQLFTDNISMPIQIKGNKLWYLPNL